MFSSKSPANASGVAVDSASPLQNPYRLPKVGEAVKMEGMRRRPHLNGAQAEVVSNRVDEDGFLTVRVFNDSRKTSSMDASPARPSMMKVRPNRLQPLTRSVSTPGMERMLRGEDDWESARSLSTKGRGSLASSSVSCSSGTGSRYSSAGKTASAVSGASRSRSVTPMPASWYKQGVAGPGAYASAVIHGRIIPQEKWDKFAIKK